LKTTLDSKFISESFERLADKLGSIIIDYPSRHTKAVYYVMLDEFDHVERLYFLQGDGFNIFGEVIDYK